MKFFLLYIHRSLCSNLELRVALSPVWGKFLDIRAAFICPSVIFSGLGDGSLSSSIS